MSKPESLFALQTMSAPVFSEQEDKLYFVKTFIDEAADKYFAHIYEYDTKTGVEVPVVTGNARSYMPTIQKNRLLYLSDRDGCAQVYELNLTTRETTQLTFSKKPITHVSWLADSPDFIFSVQLANEPLTPFKWTDLQAEDIEKKAPYYKFDSLSYQAEGVGFVDSNYRNYLCIQNADTSEVTVLTKQDTGYGLRRVVSADVKGEILCFEKQLHDESDVNHDSALFTYNRLTDEIKQITKDYETGIFSEGSISPDGKWIAFIGNPLPYETRNQFKLYLYNVKTENIEEVSPDKDIQYGDNSVSDYFQNIAKPFIQWHPDSQSFYIQSSEFGLVKLYQVSLDKKMTDISPDRGVIKEYCVGQKGTICALLSQPKKPMQLYYYNQNEWSKLATETEKFYQEYQFGNYKEVSYPAADGKEIHGFLVMPPNYDSSKQYPFILNIHGGPYAMHADTFFHEAQFLAANGYMVLLPNPRGSYGYGQEFTHAVYQRYAQEDYTDLMSAVDQLLVDYPAIDKEQLFVTGGSYGGYLTNWIVTHTNRFKAAVTQRSMTNLLSMIGTSDTGYFFLTNEVGGDWLDYDRLWEMSPLAHAQHADTPLLIIHALEDKRVPFEQAQQFYASLKYFDKTAEMLVFPDSTHELSRKGRPSYRVARLQHLVEWFNEYRD